MIPIATTTIAVLRVTADPTYDGFDSASATPATVASGVRAVIGEPSGSETVQGNASQEDVTYRLDADPVSLLDTDQVRDEVTGDTYDVVWARARGGFGLSHTVAGLRQVRGAA